MISLWAHLAVMAVGFVALVLAILTGDWRFLFATAVAYYITVKT